MIIGAVNGTMPYILSFFGKEPVAEIGIAWITEVVAVIIGYLIKAYSETKQEKKQRHADFVAGMDIDEESEVNEI